VKEYDKVYRKKWRQTPAGKAAKKRDNAYARTPPGREYHRTWCTLHKEQRHWLYLARMTGVSVPELKRQFKKQKGKCALCHGKQKVGKRKTLCADHCHATKKFRAFLCFKCNALLGMAMDSIELLERAIKYLRRFK
jgi:hypothetical protein